MLLSRADASPDYLGVCARCPRGRGSGVAMIMPLLTSAAVAGSARPTASLRARRQTPRSAMWARRSASRSSSRSSAERCVPISSRDIVSPGGSSPRPASPSPRRRGGCRGRPSRACDLERHCSSDPAARLRKDVNRVSHSHHRRSRRSPPGDGGSGPSIAFLGVSSPALPHELRGGARLSSPPLALGRFHKPSAVDARNAAAPSPPLDRWWTGFCDPVLTSIVERALEQNLDLASALARVDQARAAARDAGAALLPTADATSQALKALPVPRRV